MTVGEFVAVVEIVTLPVESTTLVAANVTFRVALCPGMRTCPADMPLAVKPVPETLTFKIVTGAPREERVTGRIR
jgi:hypothetical protein